MTPYSFAVLLLLLVTTIVVLIIAVHVHAFGVLPASHLADLAPCKNCPSVVH